MNHKINFLRYIMQKLTAILLTLFLTQAAYSADSDKVLSEKLIKEAKRSYKQVVKLNNAWRDTHKIIKKAEKAHTNKKYSKSMKLAEEALNQSKMAIEQHNSQKHNYRFLDN